VEREQITITERVGAEALAAWQMGVEPGRAYVYGDHEAAVRIVLDAVRSLIVAEEHARLREQIEDLLVGTAEESSPTFRYWRDAVLALLEARRGA
jgi:hypothetical protein